MQLKYRGCAYTPNATQATPANVILTYHSIQYRRNATAPQFIQPQHPSLMYRGFLYFAC